METSIALGLAVVIEALENAAGYVDKVYLKSTVKQGEQLDYLFALCKKNNVPYVYDDKFISANSFKDNCYGLAVFKTFYLKPDQQKHLLLYGFSDPGQLGTIMRSAVSFDFHNLILINSSVDPFSVQTVRASMGSIFHMKIASFSSFEEYKNEYSHTIYPFMADGTELKKISLQDPYTICFSQDYDALSSIFENGYYLEHSHFKEISFSALSTIVLNYCFHQSANGMNSSGKTD